MVVKNIKNIKLFTGFNKSNLIMSYFFVSIFLFFSCVSVKKDNLYIVKKIYDKAIVALNKGESDSALIYFEKIINEYPAKSYYYNGAILGKAYIFLERGKFLKAKEDLNKIINLYPYLDINQFYEALFFQAFCYEALNQDIKAIVNLQDILRSKQEVPFELKKLLIPARLSIIYYRQKEIPTYQDFLFQAQNGLKRLKITYMSSNKNKISKIAYYMGTLINNYDMPLKEKLVSLKNLQPFLLESMEASNNWWAQKSSEELLSFYLLIWDDIKRFKVNQLKDKALYQYLKIKNQNKLAEQVLQLILNLENSKLPLENEVVKNFFFELDKLQIQIEQFIYKKEHTEEVRLTEEARKKRNIIKEKKLKLKKLKK